MIPDPIHPLLQTPELKENIHFNGLSSRQIKAAICELHYLDVSSQQSWDLPTQHHCNG